MPLDRIVHYSPAPNQEKTRDGYKLPKVKWTRDINDVTCNRCLMLVKKYG